MAVHTGENPGKTLKTILPMAAYLLLAILVCIAVARLCTVDAPVVDDSIGTVDLTGVDFDANTVIISNNSFLLYPGQFYMPEDFAAGLVEENGLSYGTIDNIGTYGTAKVFWRLPPGIYAISSKNTSYAQRLFINGVEYPAIGWPGDHLEAVSPKTTRYVQEFAATGDTTEIILHYAAFVHSDTGGIYPMEVGSVSCVAHNQQLRAIRVVVVSAGLIVATLFFFGLSLQFRGNRYLLWFSLLCGCISLRGLFVGDKIIMVFLPNLEWYLAIRLEVLFTLGIALFTALYLHALFPVVKQWIIWIYTGFCTAAALVVCLTPPLFFSRYLEPFVNVCAVFIVCMLAVVLVFALLRRQKFPLSGSEQILLLVGMVLYVALSVAGIGAHMVGRLLFGLDYTQAGMVVFLFLNMLALVMSFSRTERQLSAARKNELEMEQTNRTLQHLNHIRTAFLQNITHEIKTPLAAISAMAQYVNAQLEEAGLPDEDIAENLDEIAARAEQLSDFSGRLLKLSLEQEGKLDFVTVDVAVLFRQAAGVAAPVLREQGNCLAMELPDRLPPLAGVPDLLANVMVNLIVNAGRHCSDSEIRLSAAANNDMMEIRVADQGGGIPPELLHQVFDRGASGDGGSGLGLAICKEIVETHGGRIYIDSRIGEGTQVWFTIPFAKEGLR